MALGLMFCLTKVPCTLRQSENRVSKPLLHERFKAVTQLWDHPCQGATTGSRATFRVTSLHNLLSCKAFHRLSEPIARENGRKELELKREIKRATDWLARDRVSQGPRPWFTVTRSPNFA